MRRRRFGGGVGGDGGGGGTKVSASRATKFARPPPPWRNSRRSRQSHASLRRLQIVNTISPQNRPYFAPALPPPTGQTPVALTQTFHSVRFAITV